MNIMNIQEGKIFYQIRMTRTGRIYKLNKVNIDAIKGNIKGIFQIKYTKLNSDFIPYTCLYDRLYVEKSNSPYFIKMGEEEYLTLPNKQALAKAVRAQVTKYLFSFNPKIKSKTNLCYKAAMRKIKQLV
jgi:hypothetical protein